MANSRTIEFKGHFDGKQVLDELKKIRQNMADAGADDNLFKGIDKDIAATEKLVTEMMAQIQKGFSNTKEVNAFEKQIDKLQTNLLKISSGMQNVNIAENLGLNSPEITSLTKELEQLTAAQDHLKEVSKEALDQAKKSVGLRDDEIAKIKEAIDANEDLEEALKKVGKAKEKRFLSQAGEAGMQTQAGKDYIKNADAGLSLSDLGAKASSGNTAKAKNDARKRYDDGELYGDANNRQLDEVKAAAAVTEAYQKTLEKMITSGGNAAEAVEEMKKSLADYGIEIENTDQLQENFYNDIEGFYKSPAVDRGNKGNITKARKIGSTNAQGEYELSDASVQNFLNNSGVTAYSDNMRRATEVTNQLGQEIEEATRRTAELVNENDQGLNNAIQNTNNMTDATKEGAEATREASESAEKMNNTFDNMKNAVKTFLSIGSAVSALKNVVRDTFNDIKELDKSFADIAMVTDYSVKEMWSSYDQYAAMANELGQSTKSVIQASGLFYQQGLETNEALSLTEDTMKLATLAGLDFAEATSQMTAALRGFHMEMDEGGRVTDVYSELAAKAAADVEGIAYAMSKTASIASSAGMEFETTSAFLTQMIETTQEAPENIGTAMKTIIARFTELKENVAGTADSEFEDLDYNKVDTALKSVGVSIKDASGQFRDLDDVFLELSQKWNTLDRNSQRYIATIAAGSRQQSRFIAMMENYDRTVELVNTAYDSAGKSSEQFAKYQDTVEYKMNQISNSWEQLRTNLFNSDTYKGALDILNKFMSTLNNMDFKQILGVATIGLTLGKMVITNFITSLKKNSGEIQKSWQTVLNKAFDTKGKSLFETGQLKKSFNDLVKQRPDEEKYVRSMNQVLGDKAIGAPKLEANIEAQKTREIQNQLAIYNQLEAKRKSILQTAKQELREGKGISAETRIQSNQAVQESNQKLQQLNKLAKELGYEKEITAENAKQIAQNMQENASKATSSKMGVAAKEAGSNALSAGITTALMMAISGADLGTVIKSALTSALMAALPALISAIMPMLTSLLLGPAGIVLAVGAAIFAVNSLIDSYIEKKLKAEKAVEKAELKRLENVEEANKKLAKDADTTAKELVSKKKKLQTLDEQVARVEELSGKSFLTSAEQEEFDSIVSKLQEENPELISFYDENTHQLELNTYALQDVRDALLKEITDQEKVLNMQTGLQGLNGKYRIDTIEDKLNNNISDLQFVSDQGLYGDYINNIDLFKKSVADMNSDFVSDWATSYVDDNVEEMFGQGMTDKEMRDIYSKYLSGYVKNENLNVLDDTISLLNNLTQEQKELIGVASNTVWTADNIGDFVYETATSGQWDGNTAFEQVENRLKTVSEEFETLEDDYEKQVLGRAATSKIGSYVIDGKTLSQDITNILSSNLSSSFEDLEIKEKVSSQGLEGNLLSGAGLQGTEKQDLELILKTYGFGDGEGGIDQSFSEALKAGQESWDKLPEEFRNYLENQAGFDKNTWGDLQQDQINKVLAEFINVNLAGMNLDLGEISEDELQKYSSEIQQYETLLNEQTKYTKGELQKKSSDILSTVSSSARDALSLTDDTEVMKKFSELENWGKAVLGDTGLKNFTDLTLGAQQAIQKLTSDANLSTEKTQKFAQALTQMYGTYKTGTQDILKNIDLNSESYSSLLANANEYIKAIADTGEYSLQEARKIYLEYIDTASKYLTKLTFGAEGAEVLANQYNDHLKKIKEDYASLNEAQAEMIENGKISSDTYFQLLEDGMGDYVKVTTNGYELIGDAAEQAFTDQSLIPVKTLRKEIKANKEMLSLYKEINKEQFSVRDTNSGAEYTIDINTVLQQVLNGNMDAFNQLDTKIQDYILTIKEAGYSTQEEFIKALQEGTAAMEAMEPDVWIQGLVSMQEASAEVEEEINDLKDELDDLDKQLADDKKAVDETYKTWQEAIHGTENYQSSLDGLLNYERRLESFNNKLEDTKEALSDISNINDAKNLLEQTTSLYEGKLGTLKAESKVINKSLENLDKEIMANYANFVSLDEFGNMNVDISALESADMSDILKDDGFTQLLEKRNEMYDKARETDQAYLDTVKEWEEQYKAARESEIKMEETIINILKDKMQEEVDTVKEKYSALEEADNNYLDALQEAIDKQRKLREQENQYEDLATKQKKLSLMQRDTSGANQKEVQQLEKEVEDDQQNLLDSEVDNLIESMQELYEKQKEARDLEIEAMEAETENMQAINETAMTIMAGFQSVEDYQAWLLENDKTVEDMTATQTEQYLDEAKETFSGYAQYVALTAEDMQLRADEINKQADLVFENTNENVSNIGTTIQELAVAAADKAEEEAKEAYDDAVEKMNETQDKIDETTKKLNDAEDNAVLKHGAAMNAMVEASQSSMSKVSTFATKQLAEMLGYDLSKEEDIEKFAKEFNFINDKGEITQNLYNAISDSGGEASKYKTASAKYEVFSVSSSGNKTSFGFFDTKEEADALYNKKIKEGTNKDYLYVSDSGNKVVGAFKEEKKKEHGIVWPDGKKQYTDSVEEAQQIINRILKSIPSNAADGQYKSWAMENKYEIFKTGGLVNYTGPAWVDGTPTRPEAFLNAQDTQRIGEAAKILAQIPALNGASENVSTNIGDTTIEIHINVENIESDYDVDQMIERVKNDIIDVSKPIGTSVILKK